MKSGSVQHLLRCLCDSTGILVFPAAHTQSQTFRNYLCGRNKRITGSMYSNRNSAVYIRTVCPCSIKIRAFLCFLFWSVIRTVDRIPIFVTPDQPLRQFAVRRKLTVKSNFLSCQKCSRDFLCCFHVKNIAIVFLCKNIYCKTVMQVCGCCDHWYCFQNFCCFQRQFIGTAQMSGQKGNDKLSTFIYNQHRRVWLLWRYIRRNAADGNSGGTDKDQCIWIRKFLSCPCRGTDLNRIQKIFTFFIQFCCHTGSFQPPA